MKKIVLTLTPKQADVLLAHWSSNLAYGVSGTFGDGDKITNLRDYRSAEAVAAKLRQALASQS